MDEIVKEVLIAQENEPKKPEDLGRAKVDPNTPQLQQELRKGHSPDRGGLPEETVLDTQSDIARNGDMVKADDALLEKDQQDVKRRYTPLSPGEVAPGEVGQPPLTVAEQSAAFMSRSDAQVKADAAAEEWSQQHGTLQRPNKGLPQPEVGIHPSPNADDVVRTLIDPSVPMLDKVAAVDPNYGKGDDLREGGLLGDGRLTKEIRRDERREIAVPVSREIRAEQLAGQNAITTKTIDEVVPPRAAVLPGASAIVEGTPHVTVQTQRELEAGRRTVEQREREAEEAREITARMNEKKFGDRPSVGDLG